MARKPRGEGGASGLTANPQSQASKRPQTGELALQRHLVTTGKLQPEGDLGPPKKRTNHDPWFQLFYFQHIPDPVALQSPAGEGCKGVGPARTPPLPNLRSPPWADPHGQG